MAFIIVVTHVAEERFPEPLYFTLQGLTRDKAMAASFEDRDLAQGVADRYNTAYATWHAEVEEVKG